jgi:hypothetical protein
MDSHKLVHLFHIIIVGGLFLYVGINRDKISSGLFNVLFYLGMFIILYHLYKSYGYLKDNKGIWVNLIHIFIVGPILIYIGYNGAKTTRKFFEILLMLGFAAIGYHGYYLF